MFTGRNSENAIDWDGYSSSNPEDLASYVDQLGPRYFSTIRAQFVAGRDFDARDNDSAPRVAIVNEEFVRHFCEGRNPVGRTFVQKYGDTKSIWQIVGVVKDMRNADVRRKAGRYYYLPAFQSEEPVSSPRFLVRTARNPALLFPAVRAAIRAEDPNVAIASMDTAADLLNRGLDRDRLIAALSGAFGLLALVLAAIGIYGLLSYDAARRTGEVGIRMALGAGRGAIVRMMLPDAVLVSSAGIVIGAASALASSKIVTGLVFGLEPNDPRVFAAAALLLAAVALAAGLVPACRAATADPMRALRNH